MLSNDKRKKMLEELRERLEDLPPAKQLSNLWKALTHCHKCGANTGFFAEVCETCGEELMEHGKH